MTTAISAPVIAAFQRTNDRILKLVEPLPEAQFAFQPIPSAHSIAFILWHVARWTDHLQATIPKMTPVLAERLGDRPQIWLAEGLARQWGLAADRLGYEETGTHMTEETAAQLPLPTRDLLLDYTHRVFAAIAASLSAVDDEQFQAMEQPHTDDEVLGQARASSVTVGGAILSHLTHNNRHLGEIEYILGLQGLFGSATI